MDLSGLSELLSIESPWLISDIQLQKKNEVIDVYISIERGSKFPCPVCGQKCAVHDSNYIRIRHLDLFEYRCYLNVKIPRINCPRDGVKVINGNNWSRKGSHYSRKLEVQIIRLCKQMSVSAVSSELGEPDNNLWRVLHDHVSNTVIDSFDFRSVKRVCVDETAIKRGHNYISIFTDYDTGRVLFATEGRKKDVFDLFYGWLWDMGGLPSNVELFSMDMSKSYKAGRQEYFAHSEVVYDRFHIKKGLNDAIDKVRRDEVKEVETLKKTRYIWLKNENNLTSYQQEQLRSFLCHSSTKTAQAYLLKNSFDQLWSIQKEAVEPLMNEWLDLALDLVLKPFDKFVNTIIDHYQGVVMSIKTGITNAISEGLNSVMQLARSRARGFRNTKNFIAMVYFLGAAQN